jgi:hypothetical protein
LPKRQLGGLAKQAAEKTFYEGHGFSRATLAED